MGRQWEDLTPDEQMIVANMKTAGIKPEELLKRLKKSGKLNEEQLKSLEKSMREIDILNK